jgi:hypothetical protein
MCRTDRGFTSFGELLPLFGIRPRDRPEPAEEQEKRPPDTVARALSQELLEAFTDE